MAKARILLIEDDVVLSKMLYEELDEANFEILRAYEGEVGLQLALEKNPDLILLDVLLPRKNGFEVLESIRRVPAGKKIPVIMLTMLGSKEDIKKGAQLGANDYIVKSQNALFQVGEKVESFVSKKLV